MCVCVERERERQRETQREREREGVLCVCVFTIHLEHMLCVFTIHLECIIVCCVQENMMFKNMMYFNFYNQITFCRNQSSLIQ